MKEKLNKILEELKKKGKIYLFAALKMDEYANKWSIAICTDWSLKDKQKSFKEIVDIFIRNLNKEEWDTIARIGNFDKEEHLIQLLLKLKKGFEFKEETKINGFTIFYGYILESNDNAS